MQALNVQVKEAFRRALLAAFPSVDHAPIIAISKFGDFQCNSAMALFKQKSKDELGVQSPKEAGEKIAEHLKGEPLFSNVQASPQGFVTVDVAGDWLSQDLKQVLRQKGPLQLPHADKKLRVMVDFSSPNVAKEMHVGHLRSTIIGESICRILAFHGHEVQRINHIGDWGTQFGMLIEYLHSQFPDYKANMPDISDLNAFYKKAKASFDADDGFKARSREMVVKLQGGDEAALESWRLICDVSRHEFEKVYKRLDVTLEERGESYYNPAIPKVVQELTDKGMITVSDGAKCVFTRVSEVPLMAVKSDGGFGYDSTDLAAIRDRLVERQGDWLIYVTDLGQEEHFAKIFAAAEQAGWHTPPETRVDHMGFGVVQGQDGKRFKTRSGEVVKLVDLLDEAKMRALKELQRRKEEEKEEEEKRESGDGCSCGTGTAVADEEMDKAAEAIGYSAVKYFDLKQNRHTDYKFSYDRMLDPKGNTAVYMMYAYARICAIFRKAGVDISTLDPEELKIEEPAERKLAVTLAQFPDVLATIVEDLHIHRLAEYMYKVSGAFTDFYQACKVLGGRQQNTRLLLCEATRKILQASFYLLGITPLERI
ncbi:arginyl-tRNAsynthetase, related [Neospora caninum Liverpool]|uniref:arginine--tRNA ligase n=1 Tax=Neospora caninum (strain Liverpool) TaxID=572307 RepID=F0V9W1_NEOCL|nr:arginyl-tRNAsynthetase, related [Neospora caninum Liverpool]CBZ50723.1 arginyl-tRNAsynthetase, related [Neospora caninum Liverpool]CEL65334.1 TPA: Arginyl-tRNA synthetase, related [Neospora caninum Liverpool]|eukprot:XP_003880756.1 arginyl-tRNAsynthetase, related [Neospora caninum Liverpool]